ncbi:MAG TPA: helix-turn-helix transcriptional regulator [Chitinophagaceae bacterium]|nr:helix-turn-helix transcriptional regulator [Chitinophagaceae bacterium]
MIYRLYKPGLPLSNFIDFFFYFEGAHAEHRMEKLLPDGSVDLLIDLTDSPKKLFHNEDGTSYITFKKSWISGMKTNYILIDASVSNMIGVHFKPGGCYPFIHFPMAELNDLTIGLDNIWSKDANTFREAILHEPCIDKRFLILENYFLQKGKDRMENHALVHYSVNQLVTSPQMWTIKDLSGKTGITQKHLITLFKKYVGLSPKMFSRIYKFQKVIQSIEQQKKVDWSMLAYECGYFDQAHFIKEFQAFSGVNPAAYLEKRGPYINYLPIA